MAKGIGTGVRPAEADVAPRSRGRGSVPVTTTPRADATFADVFRDHRDRAVRLAYLHCGDRHRAEDAVAEAMARVWRQWRRGKVRAS